MTKFEPLTPEEVRRLEEEAIQKFRHEDNFHPHVEPRKNPPLLAMLPGTINEVQASAGPIFGHLHVIAPRHDIEILMDRLSRKDTFKARNLIEGLMIATRQNIEIKGETAEEKVAFLTRLAHVEI